MNSEEGPALAPDQGDKEIEALNSFLAVPLLDPVKSAEEFGRTHYKFSEEELSEKGNVELEKVTLDLSAFKIPRGRVPPIIPDADVDSRPQAIHIYGTDSMSTEDILWLFNKYRPSHLEWINDSSCNVVWNDNQTAHHILQSLGMQLSVAHVEKLSNENQATGTVWFALPGPQALVMRLATSGDVKKFGAQNSSLYYKVHGKARLKKKREMEKNSGVKKIQTEGAGKMRRTQQNKTRKKKPKKKRKPQVKELGTLEKNP
eukprot:m.74134 g.74134  ORF g.74134 m.74134 type:complete len:259 (+) comp12448_c0_seq2:143-919(+)